MVTKRETFKEVPVTSTVHAELEKSALVAVCSNFLPRSGGLLATSSLIFIIRREL